jgi:hypothetical protein
MDLESEQPLDPSWIIAFDDEGNDLALEAELAAMTPEQRARSEANVRAFITEARANLRPRSTHRDEPADL